MLSFAARQLKVTEVTEPEKFALGRQLDPEGNRVLTLGRQAWKCGRGIST